MPRSDATPCKTLGPWWGFPSIAQAAGCREPGARGLSCVLGVEAQPTRHEHCGMMTEQCIRELDSPRWEASEGPLVCVISQVQSEGPCTGKRNNTANNAACHKEFPPPQESPLPGYPRRALLCKQPVELCSHNPESSPITPSNLLMLTRQTRLQHALACAQLHVCDMFPLVLHAYGDEITLYRITVCQGGTRMVVPGQTSPPCT